MYKWINVLKGDMLSLIGLWKHSSILILTIQYKLKSYQGKYEAGVLDGSGVVATFNFMFWRVL